MSKDYCPHQDYGILSELAEKAREKGWLCHDYPNGCEACMGDEEDGKAGADGQTSIDGI